MMMMGGGGGGRETHASLTFLKEICASLCIVPSFAISQQNFLILKTDFKIINIKDIKKKIINITQLLILLILIIFNIFHK